MAYEISNYSVKVTLVAGADLSAAQYRFVEIGAGGVVTRANAITDKPIGVLQNSPDEGEEAEVLVVGGTKLVSGAALAVGTVVSTDNEGRGDAITVGSDTTQYNLGTTIFASGAAGEIATVLINCANPSRAA
jgi:hypothetical protein